MALFEAGQNDKETFITTQRLVCLVVHRCRAGNVHHPAVMAAASLWDAEQSIALSVPSSRGRHLPRHGRRRLDRDDSEQHQKSGSGWHSA
jgi:hypothetical protein